jgi:alpha-D-xyloside xylohydrolase
MRPLAMDFPDDASVHGLVDQYMFGPAFLVAPVTDYQARARSVALPDSVGGFYDFWTGKHLAGGQTIEASAPLERIPLFVRAGAIVPIGPELQFVAEKPADPVTLYVYTGRDGDFTLHEDDGTSYAYERGERTSIELRWREGERELSIGERKGSFPGQLQRRTFHVVLVSPESPVGFRFEQKPQHVLTYEGKAVRLRPGAAG